MGRQKPKNRTLSTYEFFEQIQIEYIVAILRARIYTLPHDKKYWNRVAEGKKVTIESITEKNQGLPNIFTDSDLKAALERRVYNDSTYPNFTYRDEDHKKVQEYFDLLHYYAKDSDVRFDIGLGIQHGKVKMYKPLDKFVVVKDSEDNEYKLEVSKVARIL